MSGAKKKLERRALRDEMGLTEKQKQELKAQKTKRRNAILATVGAVVAVVLVVILLVWNSGFLSRHTTALTVKDTKLSIADMDYYYFEALNYYASNEQSMAQIYEQNGLTYESSFDPRGDMKTQYVDEEQSQSYYDYFCQQAKENATEVCALYDAAVAAGHTLSEDAQAQLDDALTGLDTAAAQYNFGSRDAYLKALYGRNMTQGVYLDNLERRLMASDYYNAKVGEMGDYSDEELTAYYEENADELDCYDYEYVYFDGTAQGATDENGETAEPTEEESAAAMAEAQTKAQALLDAVKAAQSATPADGEQAQTFSDVAAAQDLSSVPRDGVMGSNFSSLSYAEWLMDPARQDGDVDLFEMEDAGWYVVQFHDRYQDDDPTVDARHILLSTAMEDDPATEDVDESTLEPTEERIAQVRAQAEDILAEYQAGEQTAAAFGELAEEYSEDGRDADNNLSAAGGLYTGIAKGDMVQPFEDWCFDPSRQPGDTGLVQTDFGWHVMYFEAVNRPVWMDQAESGKQADDQEAFMDQVQEGYEAQEGRGWSKIGLN